MKYEYAYGIDKHCKSLQKRAMMPKSAQGGVLKYPCQAQSKQNDPAPHNTIQRLESALFIFCSECHPQYKFPNKTITCFSSWPMKTGEDYEREAVIEFRVTFFGFV